jgi:DSF synthase
MTASHEPSAALPTRRFTAKLDEEIPAHWCRGDAALSHVLNTYTLLVPDNEGFYIRTLRECIPRIDDAALVCQVNEFARQEGQHGVGHRKAWNVLERQGYKFRGFVNAVVRFAYKPIENFLPLWMRVSVVSAVEHTNAYIGREFLAADLLQGADEEMRALFEWHFAEEIEHRAVSFDVLQKLWPSYGARLVGAALTFPTFYALMSIGALYLMAQDGSAWRASSWKKLWQHLWSRDRMIQRTLGHIAAYLKPSFHPAGMADDALAQATIVRWQAHLNDPSAPVQPIAETLDTVSTPIAPMLAPAVPTLLLNTQNSAAAVFASLTAQIAASGAVEAIEEQPDPEIAYLARREATDAYSRNWYEDDNRTYWSVMHHRQGDAAEAARPCFHPQLMGEMRAFQQRVLDAEVGRDQHDLAHFVLASDASVFNLGGDLRLFADAIRRRDRESLLGYARLCVRGVHAYHAGMGANVHSVALVQGDALGGGFEAALSCRTIVAEEHVTMGLPEVLFDLFPGMGAFPFIKHRVGAALAEQLIMSGRTYTATELQRMGLVDVVAPRGEGVAAVEHLIRQQRKHPHTRVALNRIRGWSDPVMLDDLLRTTELWVDTALALGDKSLRTMERLVRAQEQRHVAPAEKAASAQLRVG